MKFNNKLYKGVISMNKKRIFVKIILSTIILMFIFIIDSLATTDQVSNQDEFIDALENKSQNIELTNDIEIDFPYKARKCV